MGKNNDETKKDTYRSLKRIVEGINKDRGSGKKLVFISDNSQKRDY